MENLLKYNSTDEIEKLYSSIKEKVIIEAPENFNPVKFFGCDVSYRNKAYISGVLWNIQREKIEKIIKKTISEFNEYIPGKFSLRELPLILKVFKKLNEKPDCIMVDGHGIAHPDGSGLACFTGVILNIPTIGCAKNLLSGHHKKVGSNKGDFEDILFRGRKIGEAICTRNNTKPVFISPGHLIDFKTSRELVLKLAMKGKYPEPLRLADVETRKYKKEAKR